MYDHKYLRMLIILRTKKLPNPQIPKLSQDTLSLVTSYWSLCYLLHFQEEDWSFKYFGQFLTKLVRWKKEKKNISSPYSILLGTKILSTSIGYKDLNIFLKYAFV